MKKNTVTSLVALLLFFAFSAFKPAPKSGKCKLIICFQHFVDKQPLKLNDSLNRYLNANGDSFYITTFKYYISNITLTKTNDETITIPDSYLLVNAADSSTFTQQLPDVPAGKYKNISFIIGVDSLRNFSGAQTGCLDPAKGMFWTWKNGYIFVKMEGYSPQSSDKKNRLVFHIGGAIAPNNTIRNFSQILPKKIKLKQGHEKQIGVDVNAAALFRGKSTVDFSTLNFTMGGPKSVVIADNYSEGLFTVTN
ncbi:MAG TPA: MbnP family protein [Puia sp.]|nr:MbnP family protein [Puia sp.]